MYVSLLFLALREVKYKSPTGMNVLFATKKISTHKSHQHVNQEFLILLAEQNSFYELF